MGHVNYRIRSNDMNSITDTYIYLIDKHAIVIVFWKTIYIYIVIKKKKKIEIEKKTIIILIVYVYYIITARSHC